MTSAITLVVILTLIGAAALLIRALNSRHEQRIAASGYGDVLAYRRRATEPVGETGGAPPTGSGSGERRSGSRRRLRSPGTTAASGFRSGGLLASPDRVTSSDSGASTPRSDASESPPGLAEVRIVAASPEAARRVAEGLRHMFAGAEQRSYPAGPDGSTRLHLTVDTTRGPQPLQTFQAGAAGRHTPGTERRHADEP